MDSKEMNHSENRSDRVISALIGLAGVCGNNPKTENTDRVILQSLAASPETDADTIVQAIHREKDLIAPDCARCQTPCGNTADYDMSRIDRAAEPLCSLKRRLIALLRERAARAQATETVPTPEETAFFYQALSALNWATEPESIESLLEEGDNIKS